MQLTLSLPICSCTCTKYLINTPSSSLLCLILSSKITRTKVLLQAHCPCGPVVKIQWSHCHGLGLIPDWGIEVPTLSCCMLGLDSAVPGWHMRQAQEEPSKEETTDLKFLQPILEQHISFSFCYNCCFKPFVSSKCMTCSCYFCTFKNCSFSFQITFTSLIVTNQMVLVENAALLNSWHLRCTPTECASVTHRVKRRTVSHPGDQIN